MEQEDTKEKLEREFPYHRFKCLNCGLHLNKSEDIEYYPLNDRDCPRCGMLAWEELEELQRLKPQKGGLNSSQPQRDWVSLLILYEKEI